MPPSVRFATNQDARELAELRWLSRDLRERESEPLKRFERAFRTWLDSALVGGNWHIAVAVSGRALAGCMYLHFIEKVPVPGQVLRRWAYVTNAYVREGLRGAGTGGALLRTLIDVAQAEKAEFVVVWPSREAVRLYERAGFLSAEREREALPDEEPSLILHLSN